LFLKLQRKIVSVLGGSNMGGVCLHHTHTHTSFDISSTTPHLHVCGHIRLCITPQTHQFLNPKSKARHPSSLIHGV